MYKRQVVAIDVVEPTEASFVVQVNDVSGKKRAALIDPGSSGNPTATVLSLIHI